MTHPRGAITVREDLENIIALGLTVEVWDTDPATIRTRKPTNISQGIHGQIINFTDGLGHYARWYGLRDPSYNALGVLCTLADDSINKAESSSASLYMFNTREEAVAAKEARDLERKKNREAQRSILLRNRESRRSS